MKKLCALVLCAALLFLPARGAEWYEPYVDQALASGLMNGAGEDFAPGRAVTKAELTVVAARLIHLYQTGEAELEAAPFWYLLNEEDSAGRPLREVLPPWLVDALYYVSEYFGQPLDMDELRAALGQWDQAATRRELAEVLYSCVTDAQDLGRAGDTALTELNPVPYLPDTGAEAVTALCAAGVLTGADPYGTFYPDRGLTRAELAAALVRLLDPGKRVSFTLEEKTEWENFTLTPIPIPEGYRVNFEGLRYADAFFYHSDGAYLHLVNEAPEGIDAYDARREGILDKDGSWVIPPEWQHVEPVGADGVVVAWVPGGDAVFLDLEGKPLTPYSPTCATGYRHQGVLMTAETCGKGAGTVHRAYDAKGRPIGTLPGDSSLTAAGGRVGFRDRETGLCGFYDLQGSVAIPARYEDYHDFSEGLAAVCRDGMWGLIDVHGNQVIPFRYELPEFYAGYAPTLLDFHEGVAAVGVRQADDSFLFGAIGPDGEEILPMEYTHLGRPSEGMISFLRGYAPGDSGYVDLSTGDEVSVVFNGNYGTGMPFSDGLAVLRTGGFGYIGRDGETVIPDLFDQAGPVVDGEAIVILDGKAYVLRVKE